MKKNIIRYLKENGRKGGLVTKKKYGRKYYSRIGKIGGRAKKNSLKKYKKNETK